MDYLHAGVGKFVLVTGDQDFIPLISRLRQDGREVTVIYGDKARLSAELRQALEAPGVESLDIAELTPLSTRRPETGFRALLGLLELQRRGFILGGKENGTRTSLLQRWGVLENDDENGYWSLISTMSEKVVRNDAAVMDKGEWRPQNATRTYLNLTPERAADIAAIDFAIRLISARPKGLTISGLRAGPLQTDNGVTLDRVLDALVPSRRCARARTMLTPRPDRVCRSVTWNRYVGFSPGSRRNATGSGPRASRTAGWHRCLADGE